MFFTVGRTLGIVGFTIAILAIGFVLRLLDRRLSERTEEPTPVRSSR